MDVERSKLLAYLLSLYLICVFASEETENQDLIVSLEHGKVEGFSDVSTGGKIFYSFLGIPYAKPPIGDLRFQKAQPPEQWSGIRSGKEKPPPCSQIDYHVMLRDYNNPFTYKGEEDCLFINVHTKQISKDERLAVMVYFHGGGYASGAPTNFGPHDLMDDDVVVVFVQYRLGLLGFLWTGDSALPSNLGLRDQTFALEWVQQNIQSFGGDPNEVTLFGNSAGAGSIHGHILSDYSNGLFRRAILLSGTLLCPWAKMVDPQETAMRVGDHFDCFKEDSEIKGLSKSKRLISCLRALDVVEILKMTRQLFEWSFLPKRTVPYVDGDFFPKSIEVMVREGKMKPIDVIYGVTKNEGAFVSSAILKMEEQRKAIKDQFSKFGPISLAFDKDDDAIGLSKRAYDYYVGGVKNEMEDYFNLTRLYSDHHFKVCSDNAALFHSKVNERAKRNTYFYEYHHKGRDSFLKEILKNPPIAHDMISHTDDLFSLFRHGARTNDVRRPEDAKVSKVHSRLFTNFAKYGNPTPDMTLGFKWEPFSVDSPKHLKIAQEPVMEDDLRKEERKFWRSLPTKYNKLLFGEDEILKEEL